MRMSEFKSSWYGIEKCIKCGDPTLKYVKSRRKNWKGRLGDSNRESSMKPRTDFKVKCKCGYSGEMR